MVDFEQIYENASKEKIRKYEEYKNYHKRELFFKIEKELNNKPRIKIISGLRGIGKTSTLLHLSEKEDSFYISLDNPIYKTIDTYKFIQFCIETKGKELFLIDECHFLENWPTIIKSLSDSYPKIKFIISGSSALALYNLERRAKNYFLKPLSFYEYLYYKGKKIDKTDFWLDYENSLKFTIQKNLEKYYYEYLKKGGFPFSLDLEEELFYKQLYKSIMKSIKEDSIMYAKMSIKKIFAMEKIIISLALSHPGELSINSISKKTGISKDSIYEIINILEKMNIIRIIRSFSRTSFNRKESKILFSHPNIRYAICKNTGFEAYTGALREEFALHHLELLGYKFYLPKKAKKTADYIIQKNKETAIIEIGGKNKNKKQIKGIDNAYVLKDANLIALGVGKSTTFRKK